MATDIELGVARELRRNDCPRVSVAADDPEKESVVVENPSFRLLAGGLSLVGITLGEGPDGNRLIPVGLVQYAVDPELRW